MSSTLEQQKVFATKLKELREAKGVTQYQLCKNLGIDRGRYNKLEKVKNGFLPTEETINRIAFGLALSDREKLELFSAAGRVEKTFRDAYLILERRPELLELLQLALSLSEYELKELNIKLSKNSALTERLGD